MTDIPDVITLRVYARPTITTSMPLLEGARCVQHRDTFDRTTDRMLGTISMITARRDALAICRTCPVLELCRAWVDSLPRSQQPVGVIGGRIIRSRRDA
jgi:WhiB family redox-sensing transcriptional regulator